MTEAALPCSQCGEVHDLRQSDFGFAKPDPYFAIPEEEREKRCYCDPDVADIDSEHFFLRTVLPLVTEGRETPFSWGVWVKVAKKDYRYYLEHWEDPKAADYPPFAGRLVTQIRSYPRTLGVPVEVQLLDPGSRPTIRVTDPEHPLAVEQRDGISLEALEQRFVACLHPDTWTPSDHCRTPELETHGWAIENAAQLYQARRGVLWMPPRSHRDNLEPGHYAKVIVALETSDFAGNPITRRERLWVAIDDATESAAASKRDRYSGTVTNNPVHYSNLWQGERLWFGADDIIDISYDGTNRVSQDPEVLQCTSHGPSEACLVCSHLLRPGRRLLRKKRLGFNYLPDGDSLRPPAVCDACARRSSLDDSELQVVCAQCYDDMETEHATRS